MTDRHPTARLAMQKVAGAQPRRPEGMSEQGYELLKLLDRVIAATREMVGARGTDEHEEKTARQVALYGEAVTKCYDL